VSFALQSGTIVANVTSADDGPHTLNITAVMGVSATSVDQEFLVVPVPIVTIAPVVFPPLPLGRIPDNLPPGTIVATVGVKMSDGSPFTGTLTLTSKP